MQLSKRQETIVSMVQEEGPITGHQIAKRLDLSRSALRSDLAVLTMIGVLDARPKVGYYYVGTHRDNPVAGMIASYRVSQVMASPVAVDPKMSVYDTIVTMFTEDVGSILVCDGEYLAGIVSRKDLLRASLGHNDMSQLPISMIMTPSSKLVTVGPEDTVIEAAQKLIDYEVDCLPVVVDESAAGKRSYRVVGRISKTSMTRFLLDCGRS